MALCPVLQDQGRFDSLVMADAVGDQSRPRRQRVCGDHHIHFADRLPRADESVADLGVPIRGFCIPRQDADDFEKLAPL